MTAHVGRQKQRRDMDRVRWAPPPRAENTCFHHVFFSLLKKAKPFHEISVWSWWSVDLKCLSLVPGELLPWLWVPFPFCSLDKFPWGLSHKSHAIKNPDARRFTSYSALSYSKAARIALPLMKVQHWGLIKTPKMTNVKAIFRKDSTTGRVSCVFFDCDDSSEPRWAWWLKAISGVFFLFNMEFYFSSALKSLLWKAAFLGFTFNRTM